MNLENAIYDIKMLLTKSHVTKETRIEEYQLIDKINYYRSQEIILEYEKKYR
jgi:hypothetical protein